MAILRCAAQHGAQTGPLRTAKQAPQPSSRRTLLHQAALLATATALQQLPARAGEEAPPAPAVGDCIDCLGEVEGTLNSCALGAESCVSVQNNDEAHFVGPWAYDGSREDAIAQLIGVATGGTYDPGFAKDPLNGTVGISRADTAKYILGTTLTTMIGQPPPERPKRRVQAAFVPFTGSLVDRHTAADGSVYLRFTFGEPAAAGAGEQPVASTSTGAAAAEGGNDVIDAEFIFLKDDALVLLRAASRSQPDQLDGKLQLSLQYGFQFERNQAKLQMERLRKALRWEAAPVLTSFDGKYNNNQPMFFERLYEPLKGVFDHDL